MSAGLGQRVAPDMLVENMINTSIFLPIIQRGFEWEAERIEKFFDSLIKGIPLGLILLYQHDTSFFQTKGRRFFDKFDENTPKEQYKYELHIDNGNFLVIDGQQRLQALYLAIKGSFFEHVLYHNVRWAKTENVHEVSFRFEKDNGAFFEEEEKLYLKLQTLYEISKQHIRNRAGAPDRAERLKVFQLSLQEKGIKGLSEADRDRLMDYVENTLINVFFVPEWFAKSMIVQVMRATDIPGKNKLMNLLETFVRFNSGGLRLEKMDLMFSILKACGWTEVEDRINNLSSRTGISKDLLIKALIVLNDKSARTDIYNAAAMIETLKSTYLDFEKLILSLYDRLYQLTELPDRILKKFNFMIPAVYYFWRRPKEINTVKLTGGLAEYFLLITYNSGLRSDSYLDALVKVVKDHVDKNKPDFPVEAIKQSLKKYGVQEYLSGSSLVRDTFLTFSLLQRNNWRPLNLYNRLHVDHIFPDSRKSELPADMQNYVNSVWNYYVVFQGDNISKQDQYPLDYFSGPRERFLEVYLLPKDKNLLKKENFKKLIEWRQQRISELFRALFGIEVSTID